jgi:hypothetical protein
MKATIKETKHYSVSSFVITHVNGKKETFYNARHAYNKLNYLNGKK